MEYKDKIEYFLNAVHYCLWLSDKKSGYIMEKIVNVILFPIVNSKRYRRNYSNPTIRKNLDTFFYDEENGWHIGWANHWFGYFYSCYSSFIAFIVVGIANRLLGSLNMVLFLLFFGIPIGLLYIPAYRAVFSKDRYLGYFKLFDKKDEKWHKKWKHMTIAFCMGSIIAAAAGFFCMAIITSI